MSDLYLELMKRALMGYISNTNDHLAERERDDGMCSSTLQDAHTMIGRKRLNNLQYQVETVLRDGIPGDLIECGVWRGGASIFLRAILKAYGIADRTVWVVDSFQGLHPPDYDKYPSEQHNPRVPLWEQAWLRVSLDMVKQNFQRYELLDEQVRFLEGWVEQTLPMAPIDKLAYVRIDVDMYEPTMACLETLYPKLSIGGFIDFDDFPIMEAVRNAMNDYRARMGIRERINVLEGYTGAYWRKEA